MSLLRKSVCQNCANATTNNVGELDTGIISVQVVPQPSVSDNALDEQTKLAEDCQNKFASHLMSLSANTITGSAHANVPARGSMKQLLPIMKDASLTFRLSHMPHGVDAQAKCAELTVEHANNLLSNGNVTVDAPSGGTFHLQSSNNAHITQVRFTPTD
tara:strand:- start:195 stop:671 length:477 start_codon:yes stop_codon:yes gene_type:complete